jgi:hypothetical protein
VGLPGQDELAAQPLDPARDALREHAGDLPERALGPAEPALLGEHEAEHGRGRLLVREHQRRKPRPRPQPVAAADPRLALHRDADVLERNRVAADRPLADAELARRVPCVDQRAALQQLEEGEKP